LALVTAFFAVSPSGEFPFNDDWVYLLSALKTFETNKFAIIGPESAWGLPQTILGAIWIKCFGFSPFKLRLLTLLFAAAGVYGFDRILQIKNVNGFTRLLAGLCLIGFFPYLPLAASSMTDLYFFALWIYACLNLELALQNDNNKNWLAGSIFILLCSLERQFGIVIALALLMCGCVMKPAHRGKWVSASLVLIITVYITNSIWSHSLLLFQNPSVQERIGNIFCAVLYLGIGFLPLALLCPVRKSAKLPYDIIALFLLFIVGTVFIAPMNFRGTIFSHGTMPFFSNILSRHGMFMDGEILNGTRKVLLGSSFWQFYTLLCIIGATFMVRELWRSKVNWRSNLPLTTLSTLLFFAVVVITRNPLFDRYLLPVFAGLLLSVAPVLPLPSSRSCRLIALGGSLCFILFSALVTENAFRGNEAKWQAATWAVAQGYPHQVVDGGYEWNSWHGYQLDNTSKEPATKKIIISYSPMTNTVVLQSFPYKSWLGNGSLYCLRRI
jgi:hypothetical protein